MIILRLFYIFLQKYQGMCPQDSSNEGSLRLFLLARAPFVQSVVSLTKLLVKDLVSRLVQIRLL